MKLLIPIDQKASIAAGFDAPSSTETFELPAANIPEDIRGYIAEQYDPTIGKLIDSPSRSYRTLDRVRIAGMIQPLTSERVVEWLRAYYASHQAAINTYQQRKQAEADKARSEAAEVLRIRKTRTSTETICRGGSYKTVKFQHPDWPKGEWTAIEDIATSEEARLWATALEASNQAAKDSARAEMEAEEEARKRKQAEEARFIRAWITTQGTESQRERQEAGLLPEHEAIQAITDATIPGEEFEPTTCRNAAISTLPDEQWQRWKAMKAGLPAGAKLAEIECGSECRNRDEFADYEDVPALDFYRARVEVTVGPLIVSKWLRL